MRDPKRIPRILKELQEIWAKNPDLRLSQLILNVHNNDFLYYIEDEELIRRLKRVYIEDKVLIRKL